MISKDLNFYHRCNFLLGSKQRSWEERIHRGFLSEQSWFVSPEIPGLSMTGPWMGCDSPPPSSAGKHLLCPPLSAPAPAPLASVSSPLLLPNSKDGFLPPSALLALSSAASVCWVGGIVRRMRHLQFTLVGMRIEHFNNTALSDNGTPLDHLRTYIQNTSPHRR